MSTYGLSVLGADLKSLAQTAQAADAAGFDAVWVRGGNVFVLRRALAEASFDVAIRELLAETLKGLEGISGYTSAPADGLAGAQKGMAAAKLTPVVMEKYDPEQALALIERYRVTHAQFVPTHFVRMLKMPAEVRSKYDLSSLQALFLAGEPLDEPTASWIHDAIKKPIVDNYWQTETGWPIAANPRGLEQLPVKPGSPSVPVPGYNIQLRAEPGHEARLAHPGNPCTLEAAALTPICWSISAFSMMRGGASAMVSIPKSEDPTVRFPIAGVTVVLPGADAEQIEKLGLEWVRDRGRVEAVAHGFTAMDAEGATAFRAERAMLALDAGDRKSVV